MRSPLALPVVAARHLLWDRRDRMRALAWGDRLGYEPRVPPRNRIEVVEWERKGPPAPVVPPPACVVGVLAHSPALAACARMLGLSVIEPVGDDPILLLERALRQRWGLLSSSADTLRALRPDRWQALSQFVRRGGTLFLHGVSQAVDLRELSRGLNVEPVRAEPLAAPSRAMLFPGATADFAGLLTGVRIETSVQGCRLRGAARALALSLTQGDSHPSVVELTAGRGRIILSSFPGSLEGDLAMTFGPENSPVLLPPLMALKRTFGQTAWHPPALLANFTVDDPALREGLLGLPYSKIVRLADEHQFHVTVATIPAELGLAQHDVISHLRSHPQAVSACYHGWNHDGYEFYRSSGRHLRFRTRSLAEQREGLRLAVEKGRWFAERTGYELDRVMVFPHGLGPAAILPDLHRLGFVASCNLDNRYPLETQVPDDPSLGLRPADTAWWGFPLLWRREIGDPGYLLDLFLGRPALTFEHARPLGRDLMPFVSRAEEISRISGRAVSWRSLDEIARHAYWQRLDPAGGWQVMMTTNEACLHNPDPNPRTFTVCRPHGPTGSRLHTEDATFAAAEGIRVTVPPESVATIQLLLGKDTIKLPPRRGCSLHPAAELSAETPVTR